jgi:hypothetical protein
MIGKTAAHYDISNQRGAGGMDVAYKAITA